MTAKTTATLAVLSLLFFPAVVAAQTAGCGEDHSRFQITLRNLEPFRPPAFAVTDEGPFRLDVSDAPDELHAIVQFCTPEGAQDARALRAFANAGSPIGPTREPGITLIKPIGGSSYIARIRRDVVSNLLQTGIAGLNDPDDPLIRWIGGIPPISKASVLLATDFSESWASPPYWGVEGGALKLIVKFHDDLEEESEMAPALGLADERASIGNNTWRIKLKPALFQDLIETDAVSYVIWGPATMRLQNDEARTAVGIDAIQGFSPAVDPEAGACSYDGMTGSGVVVAIMDTPVDAAHHDFIIHHLNGSESSRLSPVSSDKSMHGTHVAGTVGGNGYQSDKSDANGNANKGSECLWRGMAPKSALVTLPTTRVAIESGSFGKILDSAIVDHQADLSNHSYAQSYCQGYDAIAFDLDRIVRGDFPRPTQPNETIPSRAVVWSAGNNGSFEMDCAPRTGYYSVTVDAKNPIVVGATYASHPRMLWNESSLGPTLDGRIKPDLMAPGSSLSSRIKSTSTDKDAVGFPNPVVNGYAETEGTSMSAAVVSGVVATLIESWNQNYGGGGCSFGCEFVASPPFPSTIKALLIAGAEDMIGKISNGGAVDTPGHYEVPYFEGPDFATGYGLVNAEASVALIGDGPGPAGHVIESILPDVAQEHEYLIELPEPADHLRVTLVWDDEAFGGYETSLATEPTLMNDLELRVIDPGGCVHLPWVLDPPPPATTANGDYDFDAAADIIDPTTDLKAAYKGEDHLNNVEQVDLSGQDLQVDGEAHWRVFVTAASEISPQKYSLVANHSIQVASAISEAGVVCKGMEWNPGNGGFEARLPANTACGFVPTEALCRYAMDCPACEKSDDCPGIDLRLSGVPADVEVQTKVLSSGAVAAPGGGQGSVRRLQWTRVPAERYALVFSRGDAAQSLNMQVKAVATAAR